ncbi:hypothetical protein T552_02959 [Pneumocystis carinii B80]|uniref:MICOS complex subunit n=1 Tax=Pneumocystis carinii (strain B80) TaxID=1408658 RepID=A0A0W4ZDU3_PNEC8|nr:hypothetical protein T552_02959 [Pneumocystis carinii B80]KTW26478.1 hypothetical protein T552_02959 [Pneumocystis carinii B80]
MSILEDKKLPIYNKEENEVTLIKIPPSTLQLKISQSRNQLEKNVKDVSMRIENIVDKWIGIENKVEKFAKELVPSNGEIISGGIYVMIAGMAGLILTQRRSFSIRFMTPIFISLAASTIFLPETHRNFRNMIWKYKQNYF